MNTQLSFSDLSIGEDWALEMEVYRETKQRSLPDGHPVLMAYREKYFAAWLERYPDSHILAIRDRYDFMNF